MAFFKGKKKQEGWKIIRTFLTEALIVHNPFINAEAGIDFRLYLFLSLVKTLLWRREIKIYLTQDLLLNRL